MTTDKEDFARVVNIIERKFDDKCDNRTARATLVELATAMRGLRGALLFSELADHLPEDSLVDAEFLQALNHLDMACQCFRKAAYHC